MWTPYANPRGLNVPTYVREAAPQSPSLGDIAATQGPAPALAALGKRLAETLIASDTQDQAARAVDNATAEGTTAGDAAARDGTPLALADDGTVTGRARDLAFVRAYQARMQVNVNRTADDLLTQHPDDPNAVAAKWGAMAEGLKSRLPAPMAAQIGTELDAQGARLVSAATAGMRRRQEGEANADLITGMEDAARRSANAWRDGDGGQGGNHDQAFRNALFARTDLTPQAKTHQWQAYQTERRRDAVLGEYDRAKEAGGLGGATRFLRGFLDGDHPDLNPDFKTRIGNELAADIRGLESEHRLALSDLRAEASDALWRMSRGYAAPNLPTLTARAKALGDADTARQLTDMARGAADLADMARQPLAVQQAKVAELTAQANAGTDKAAVVRAEAARTVLDNTVAQLSKGDALAHMAQVQGRPLAPIAWDNVDTLKQRASDARAAWDYNRLPGAAALLTRPEIADLSARLDGTDADAKTKLLGTLSQGFGQSLPQVLEAVKSNQPDFVHAAAISAQGDARVARDILRGADIRAAYGKSSAPGGRQYMPPNNEALTAAFGSHLPHAAIANMTPDDAAGLKSAVLSAYAAKSFDKGLTHQQVVDPDLFKAAVKDVTGGILRWNGRDMVAPLRGMGQDELERVLAARHAPADFAAFDLSGNQVPERMILDNGIFEMVRPGQYKVRLGKDGKYLVGPDGGPFTVDLGAMTTRYRRVN